MADLQAQQVELHPLSMHKLSQVRSPLDDLGMFDAEEKGQ